MDSVLFEMWIRKFIAHINSVRVGDKWYVLFYDAHRAHMTSAVIENLYRNKIAVMALPAHTSDRIQPLDVCVFRPFKHFVNEAFTKKAAELRRLIHGEIRLSGDHVWDGIYEGYTRGVVVSNVRSGFAKSGLWPLHPTVLCESGIRSSVREAKTLTLCEFNDRLRRVTTEMKRRGPPEVRIRCGFIDTTNGIELTREDVREEISSLEADRRERRLDREQGEARSHLVEKERKTERSNFFMLCNCLEHVIVLDGMAVPFDSPAHTLCADLLHGSSSDVGWRLRRLKTGRRVDS